MALSAVLFDLDGTLLPMDQDNFVRAYLERLAASLTPHGYDPKALVGSIWAGTAAMVKNDGRKTNEEVFWDKFSSIFGPDARKDEPLFEAFYSMEFGKVQAACGFDPMAKAAVDAIRAMGLRVILATNPIFPAVATRQRIAWAGLTPEVFDLYTTYENSSFCKPNPDYYREILKKQNLRPEDCLMVGNDVGEDMIAESLGMKVFLLPRDIINKEDKDISRYPQGTLSALLDYIRELSGS